MTRTSLALRTATSADAYALWVWANDDETRAASHGRDVISWVTHVSWLRGKLESNAAVVLIAESEECQPVGSTRFDTTDDWATAKLSYMIAPEARGSRFSASMVADAVRWLRARAPGVVVLADVLSENERSMRVFRGLGWVEREPATTGMSTFQAPEPDADQR